MVEPHVANVDVASSNLVSRSILLLAHIYFMSFEKKLETMSEMIILAMVMLLSAFFCYRGLLLPKATTHTIDKVYEVEQILSEKR